MKASLVLVTALIFAGRLAGQEVMKNFDFSDGSTYWHGDCKPLASSMTTDFTSGSSGDAKGILVELHSSSWTKVTQEMRNTKGGMGSMLLTIIYRTSSDFKLSDRASDYSGVGPSLGFGGAQLPGIKGQIAAFFDVLPLSRTTLSSTSAVDTYTVHPDSVAYSGFLPVADGKEQTFTATIMPPRATENDKPIFCLGIPPGTGSLILLQISLKPGQGGPGRPFGMPHYP